MSEHDDEKARIVTEAEELTAAFVDTLAAHGRRHNRLDPQVVLSACGSVVIGLFATMQEVGYPPQMLARFATAAELYFQQMPGQIARVIAGMEPAAGVTVEVRAAPPAATHKGGRA